MRFSWNAAVVAMFAGLATADIVMHFDEALEGQVDKVEIITQAPGKVDSPAVFMSKGPPGDLLNKGEASKVKLTPKAALDLLLKRQYSCPAGYGYCSSFGRCCEEQYKCCPYGYCIDPTAACCPTGPCAAGKTCCGNSHCMPENASCCSDESFCYAGNDCYTFSDRAGMYCCTDNQCTAKVGADGLTTTAPTSTYTRTYTTTRTRYYYWTVTWYYYYYYWTYSAHIEASIVTSSRTSTSSTISCYTTDASAASSYFESVSETLTFSTPASATSLESIAGQTSFVGSRTAESNPQPTQNEGGGGGGGGGGGEEGGNNSEPSASESPSSTSRRPGSGGSSGGGSSGGGSASAARSLLSQFDAGFAAFLAFGATVGVIAIAL